MTVVAATLVDACSIWLCIDIRHSLGADMAVATEKDDLIGSLRDQRFAAITKLEGLTDEAARQVLVPSGWSLLDMAHHLYLGEQFWFRAMAQGKAVEFDADDPTGRWAWTTPKHLTIVDAVRLYAEEGQTTDAFLSGLPSLDVPPARLPVWKFTHHWANSIRTIVIHLIEETARHAGHIDIVRELLDGRRGTLMKELQQRGNQQS